MALSAPDPAGRAQAEALTARAALAAERDRGVPRHRRPFRVDVLPTSITYERALELGPAVPPGCALLGVGGDDLQALAVDLRGGLPVAVVAGPPGSGRSTALGTVAWNLLESGTRVLVLAPRPSPLRDLAGPGVLGVLPGSDVDPAELVAALAAAGEDPAAVVVDDGEVLRDCSARDVLRALVRGGEGSRRLVVLGGSDEELCAGLSGWQVDAKRARRGLLLSPQSVNDGDLVGLRLSRSSVGGPVVPGRGMLHQGDGRPVRVQVPLPGASSTGA